MSDSLRPHGLQHTRPPCPSPTPGIYSNSCPLSQWCHPTISSSVVPFSSHFQSFPASESVLRIWWPKYWSFSFRISPSNEYSGLISCRTICSCSTKGMFSYSFPKKSPLQSLSSNHSTYQLELGHSLFTARILQWKDGPFCWFFSLSGAITAKGHVAAWCIELKSWTDDLIYLVSKLLSSAYPLYDLGQDYLSQWFTNSSDFVPP